MYKTGTHKTVTYKTVSRIRQSHKHKTVTYKTNLHHLLEEFGVFAQFLQFRVFVQHFSHLREKWTYLVPRIQDIDLAIVWFRAVPSAPGVDPAFLAPAPKVDASSTISQHSVVNQHPGT